jgi:hypothetical protein
MSGSMKNIDHYKPTNLSVQEISTDRKHKTCLREAASAKAGRTSNPSGSNEE